MKSKQHADERQLKLKTAFETYCDMVFRLALSRTRNQTYADDILGEVFLKLTENIGKLKSNEHIKAWLIRVTINCSNNYLKKICREKTFRYLMTRNSEKFIMLFLHCQKTTEQQFIFITMKI